MSVKDLVSLDNYVYFDLLLSKKTKIKANKCVFVNKNRFGNVCVKKKKKKKVILELVDTMEKKKKKNELPTRFFCLQKKGANQQNVK